MEFDPQDLRATPGIKDQNGDYTTLPVYDAGIKLLLETFEKSTGMDAPSKKGELLGTVAYSLPPSSRRAGD